MTADLIAETAAARLRGGDHVYRAETLDQRRIRNLGGRAWGATRFHHAPQNGTQFKTYEFMFISGIFHLIFSACG